MKGGPRSRKTSDTLVLRPLEFADRAIHRRARNLGASAISQTIQIHRLMGFQGRLSDESVKLRTPARFGEQLLPSFVVLPRKKKSSEFRDSGLFCRG